MNNDKKTEQTKTNRDIDDFEQDIHLWNMISGGSAKGLMLLRKVVDATFSKTDKSRMPRVLIIGDDNSGSNFHARALTKSLCLEDIKEVPAKFIDGSGGMNSKEFFASNCGLNSAHLIYDLDALRSSAESVLWRYLKIGSIAYDNPLRESEAPEMIFCNGLMVLTVNELQKISKQIIDAMDFVVKLEPYSPQQLELIVLQRLKYCNVSYESEEVLKGIVHHADKTINGVIHFLKICLTIIGADGRNEITLKDVALAARLK